MSPSCRSRAAAAWCRRPRPPWMVTPPSGDRSTPAPIASTAARVAATSAPSERPKMTEVPSANAAKSTERWEIDFSPGGADAPLARHTAVRPRAPAAPS